MCLMLFLNVFPCVAVWEDVARDPFGGPMTGFMGKGWLGSLGLSEDEGSSIGLGVVVAGVGVV